MENKKTAQTDNGCAVFESEKIVTYYKGICGRILLTHFLKRNIICLNGIERQNLKC